MSTPKNLLNVIEDALLAVEAFRVDPSQTKDEVLNSLENRLRIILSKMLATPTCTSYCMFREEGLQ
jgi:hypothetical protein